MDEEGHWHEVDVIVYATGARVRAVIERRRGGIGGRPFFCGCGCLLPVFCFGFSKID